MFKKGDISEIVFVMPFWSQAGAMNWDSNFSYLSIVLPRLSELRPNWLWVVAWPEKGVGRGTWKLQGGSFFTDRIVPFPWPYDTNMRMGVLAFDPERYGQLEERVGPGVLWLHQVESGSMFKGGYSQSNAATCRPVIIAQHHYIIHRSLPYPYDLLFPRKWAQMGGTIAADRVVCNSQHTFEMLCDSFKELLNVETMRAVEQKTTVLRFGLLDNEPDIPLREYPVPVIVYNHRTENYKQPKVTGKILHKLRNEGVKFEVWFTQVAQKIKDGFPVDKIVGHPLRDRYLEAISVPGVNTINSVHETFCISMLDSIALGQLPVAPKKVTFPELVPQDYPFLFGSLAEQEAILRHILTTWPNEYVRWSGRLRNWAREEFSLPDYLESYLKVFDEQRSTWKTSNAKMKNEKKIDSFFKQLPPGRYRMTSLIPKLRSYVGLARQALTGTRIVREAGKRGASFDYHRGGNSGGMGRERPMKKTPKIEIKPLDSLIFGDQNAD